MKKLRIPTKKLRIPIKGVGRPMKNVRTPQFLTDLYRDLRDRRLLVPALALAVCLIAVPVALSSSPSAPPAPAVSAAAGSGPGKEAATEAAVLTRQLGVTDYGRRLERFKTKNPFRQQFVLPEVTSEVQQSSLTEPSSSAATGLTTSGGSTSGSTTAPTSTSNTSVDDAGTSTPPSSGQSHDAPKPSTQLIQRRIDVKVGAEGSLVEKTGVKQLKMLPSAAVPVVAFLGTNESGKRALFLVSSDVTGVTGDGVCLTTASDCQFLTLKAGQAESFDYAPDTLTYKLKLLEIKDVLVKTTHR